jgi:hypothetical protein
VARPVDSAAGNPVPATTISFSVQFHAAPFVVRPSTVVTPRGEPDAG